MSQAFRCRFFLLAALLAGALGAPKLRGSQTGNLCLLVVEESQTQVVEAEIKILPEGGTAPLVAGLTDQRGVACFENLPAGRYTLQVAKKPWPAQPAHGLEIQADQLTEWKIELEYEPGEPRATYEESLEGMEPGQRRGVIEQLLVAGDAQSIRELTRRLVPKRSVAIDLGFLTRGLDTKKLVDEIVRYLERGYLPPLKTARFLYSLGELGDERVVPLLIRKITDARRLPPGNYVTHDGIYDPARQYYVADEAARALVRITGREFHYEFGRSPIANQRAIEQFRDWWRQEELKKQERRR